MNINPVQIGDSVIFVDSKGYPRNAIITAVWGCNSREERDEKYTKNWNEAKEENASWATDEWLENVLRMPYNPPSLNVVYVSEDESQNDPYGRQIARSTSVSHQSVQTAPGYYWK